LTAGRRVVDDPSPCTLLDWDTQHFGVRIARANEVELTEQALEEIDAWSRTNGIECLYFLGKSTSREDTGLLTSRGYRQVDIRVTLEWLPIGQLSGFHDEIGVTTRLAIEADLPSLRQLVRSRIWRTRFSEDSGFDRGRVKELYVEWLDRSFVDDDSRVLVAEYGDDVVALVSAGMRGREGSIDLVCCAVSWERRGVVSLLVRLTMAALVNEGCQRIEVVTQARNAPAMALYKRCGFAVLEARPWFHKWYR
jgi:ribosomal protein S18 acetylase RimI-like enzyme